MAAEVTKNSAAGTQKSKVAKNTVIYLTMQSASWLVTFLYISIVWRKIGDTATGQLTVIGATIGTIFSLFSLGIETFLVKEVGRSREEAIPLIAATIGLRLAMILPLILISLVVLALGHHSAFIWQLALVALIGASLNTLFIPLRAVLSGLEQARRVSLVDFITSSSALLALPFLRYGPISLLLANLAVLVVMLGVQWWWVTRQIPLRPLFDLLLWKQIVRGGLPFFANSLILQLYIAAAVFLLRYYTDEASVGVMSAGYKLFGTLLFLPTALSSALLPAMSRLAFTDPEAMKRMQLRVLSLLIVLALPVAVLVTLLADPLCTILVGNQQFHGLPAVLRVQALMIFPVYIVTVMYQFLVAQNKGAVWGWFLAGTAILNGILCVVLIPFTLRTQHNGVVGSAVATLIAELCSVIAALWLLKINLLKAEIVQRTMRAILAAALMAGAILFTQQRLAGWNQHWGIVVTLVIPTAIGLLVFGILGWVLRVISPEEQQQIGDMVRQKLRPR